MKVNTLFLILKELLSHLKLGVSLLRDRHRCVVTCIELLAYSLKCLDSALNILQCVCCSRDDTQDNLALRDNGVYYNRAEDTIVLAQIDDKVSTLLVTALHIDGCYG